MRFEPLRPFFRALAVVLAALALPLPALAQMPPAPAVTVAVNPLTNKVYFANQAANSVTVLDAASGESATIPVGPAPRFIVVNPVTNRVYVNNFGNGTLSVIDGETDTNLTPTPYPLGTWGPMVVNPVTNTIYLVRLTGTGTDEATFFNGDNDTWYSIAIGSHQPIALAVNPVTNVLYTAQYATGDVRMIDGTFNPANDHPASPSIGVWSRPFAVAVNPVTNKLFGIGEDSRGPVWVIDGATQAATFPAVATGRAVDPRGIAVNPVTNKAYAVFRDEIIVIDGATLALAYVPAATGSGPVGVGIDTATNKVYVATDNGLLLVLDGASNVVSTRTIPAQASSIGVNPVTREVYVHGEAGMAALEGNAGSASVPLVAHITPLPGDHAGPGPVEITLDATSTFSPVAPPVRTVYYQLDSTDGPWHAATGSGPWTATLAGPGQGAHTLYAFAVDGQETTLATGPQGAPVVGAMASYAFTVALGEATVSLAASSPASTAGEAVTFTANVAGTLGQPTGTVAFSDGATPIPGCESVALASGSAVCLTTALAPGAHTIGAAYSGDATYGAAASPALGHQVTAPATVSLSASSATSVAGDVVTFTASVSGAFGVPGGSVAFRDGAAAIAGCEAVALLGGAAQCATAGLAPGPHSITAAYPGNATYQAATSGAVSHEVLQGELAVVPSSLDFGAHSMGTTSPPRLVTVTNGGTAPVTISSATVDNGQFAAASHCGVLGSGASCTIEVRFDPAIADAPLNGVVPAAAMLTLATDRGPHTVAITGQAEKSFIAHYYQAILRRAPEAGGKAFWAAEAERLAAKGASVNETWYAMATAFFSSAEYASFGRDHASFVADLYRAFFNREPDVGGAGFWVAQLQGGIPREVVLVSFLLSPEFTSFARAVFGDDNARPEVAMVGDFYRGLLARLPDSAGLDHWAGRFRAAQCAGAGAVAAEADGMSALFAHGAEYQARGRTNAQFVGDLYNAILRRGGEEEGVRFWITRLEQGASSREDVRRAFVASPEFQARASAIASAGCAE